MAYVDVVNALSPDGYWRLNDVSGTTATAQAGSNGTYSVTSGGSGDQNIYYYAETSLIGSGEGACVRLGGAATPTKMSTACRVTLPLTILNTDSWTISFLMKHPDVSGITVAPNWENILRLFTLKASNVTYIIQLEDILTTPRYNFHWGDYWSGFVSNENYQVVISYDSSSSTLYCYLNNTLIGSHFGTYLKQNYVNIYLGSSEYNPSNTFLGLASSFQEAFYVKRVITSEERETLYRAFQGLSDVNNTLTGSYDVEEQVFVSNTLTIDNALGASLVSNTIELPFNVSGLEITGGYESYVESLSPRRWYKLGDYDGAYTYDYGSDGVNAEVTFTDGVVTGKVCPQSLDGGLQIVDSGYVKVQNLFNTSVYTVSFWIKGWPSTPSTTYYLFSSDNGTSAGRRVFVKDDEIQFYYSFMTSPFPLVVGKSHMVTVVSNNGTNSLYLDGRPCNVLNNTGTNTLLNAYFGANWGGTDKATNTTFDEILIFDYNLTDDEIRNLYANSFFGRISHNHRETILSLVPKAYWRLGESSGGTIEDEVGNYDLSYYTPILGVSSLSLRDTDNTCVSTVDGVGSGTAETMIASYKDWSTSLIVSPSNQNTFCDILTLPAEGGVKDFAIYSSTDVGHKTLMFGEPSDWGRKGANVTYTNGEVYHIVVRYTGGVYQAFLNGQELTLTTSGTRTYPESFGTVYLGDSENGDATFEGSMDEVAVFDYYLSDAQIQELYFTMSTSLVSDTLDMRYGMISANYLNYLKCQWDVVDSDGNIFVDPTGKLATGIEVPT